MMRYYWRIRAAWWRLRWRLLEAEPFLTLDLRPTPIAKLVLPDGRLIRVQAGTTYLEIPVEDETPLVLFDGLIDSRPPRIRSYRYRLDWTPGMGFWYVPASATEPRDL